MTGDGMAAGYDRGSSREERLRRLAKAPSYSPDEIQQQRIALDLTQETLAERVGVAKITVKSWEQGRRRPQAENALRLQELFREVTE